MYISTKCNKLILHCVLPVVLIEIVLVLSRLFVNLIAGNSVKVYVRLSFTRLQFVSYGTRSNAELDVNLRSYAIICTV